MATKEDRGAGSRPSEGATFLAVAIGGFGGGEARWLAGLLAPDGPAAFPWITVAINVLGAFVLTLLLTAAPLSRLRPLLGTGVLGALTTWSGMCLQAVLLAEGGRAGVGAASLAVSLLAGLAAAGAGHGLGRRVAAR